jgi:hypothetical protein
MNRARRENYTRVERTSPDYFINHVFPIPSATAHRHFHARDGWSVTPRARARSRGGESSRVMRERFRL